MLFNLFHSIEEEERDVEYGYLNPMKITQEIHFQASIACEYKPWVSEGSYFRKAKQVLEKFDLVGRKDPK